MASFPSSAQTFEIEVRADAVRHPAPASGGPEPWIVPAREGESLLRALQRADAPVLSVCGGQASCGACRIEIDPAWFDRLPPAGRTESALLECLDDPVPTHRLACQVTASGDLAGLHLTLAP